MFLAAPSCVRMSAACKQCCVRTDASSLRGRTCLPVAHTASSHRQRSPQEQTPPSKTCRLERSSQEIRLP